MTGIATVTELVVPKNGTIEAVEMIVLQREALEAVTTTITDVTENGIVIRATVGAAETIDRDRVELQSPIDVEMSVETRGPARVDTRTT